MTNFKTLKTNGTVAGLAILASLMFAPSAFAESAPTLKIENFIGVVNIETGNFDKITIVDADGANITKDGKSISIDDDRETNNVQCRDRKKGLDHLRIGTGGGWFKSSKNYKSIRDFPSITIKAPQNTHLIINKSVVFGNVENIGSGDIYMRSCGMMDFADVAGDVDLHVSGIAHVTMGNVGSTDVHVSGATEVELGDVDGFAKIRLSGASNLNMGRIDGGMEFEGSGATDFKAAGVSGGDLSVRVSGSADFTAREGKVKDLYIRASGASDALYKGSSVDADLRASGASDVSVRMPSGNLHESDSGAGDVHITN